MKTTKRLWPFLLADNKLAEKYLEKQAEKGLILQSIFPWGLWATYRCEAPQKRKYCIDGFKGNLDEHGRYLRMANDAGWSYVTDLPGYIFFVSKEGEQPTPTQTDWREEYLQIRKGLWSMDMPMGIVASVLLILLGAFLHWIGFEEGLPLEWKTIHSEIIFIFFLMGFARAIWFYIKSEVALRRNEPMALSSAKSAMIWGYTREFVGIVWVFGLWYNCITILLENLQADDPIVFTSTAVLSLVTVVFLVIMSKLMETDDLGRKRVKQDTKSKIILGLGIGTLAVAFTFWSIVLFSSI